jgi:ABC-2 type transport system ATP-binding protein
VLLLDEPLDGLDLRQARDVTALLRREADAGRALLVAVHQLPDAARLCDRFVLLQAGRVAGAGTLDELRDTARLPGGALEDVFLALT